MKRLIWIATLVAAVLTVSTASTAVAQGQPQQSYAPGVAIIDLTYIFENHPGFQARRDAMRQEVEQAEQEVKTRRDEMRKLAERLESFRAGTPEYKQLEEELSRRSADLNVSTQLKKKDFLLSESKMYYTVYQEVLDEVRFYAERNAVNLVLRFNGEPIDTSKPEEVLKELNKSVVYYNTSIDITPIILEQLKRRQGGAPLQGSRPAPTQQQVPRR